MNTTPPFANHMNITQTIAAQGLACPMPLLKLKQALHKCLPAQQVVLIASDPHSQIDIQRFCQISGYDCHVEPYEQLFYFLITKH